MQHMGCSLAVPAWRRRPWCCRATLGSPGAKLIATSARPGPSATPCRWPNLRYRSRSSCPGISSASFGPIPPPAASRWARSWRGRSPPFWRPNPGMAERPTTRARPQVRLDYSFDRLLAGKLQQVYEILVADQVRVAREYPAIMEGGDGDRGDLRAGIVGHAAGGEHDRQPDGSADRLRAQPQLSGSGGVGLRRRRL